jgi:RNA polymerase sigma-70 factor (ECF subfamily)
MVGHAIAMSPPLDQAAPPHPERLARMFDTHHARLYSLARRMTASADAARDVVQDTFLRAARSPSSIPDGHPHEEAWLVRVLVNICRDEWRKQAVRRRHAQDLPQADVERGHEAALIARSTIWQALSALPPRRRAVIVMYELEGAQIPVIAKLLGVHAVTVRWHLSMGRRELARLLGATS